MKQKTPRKTIRPRGCGAERGSMALSERPHLAAHVGSKSIAEMIQKCARMIFNVSDGLALPGPVVIRLPCHDQRYALRKVVDGMQFRRIHVFYSGIVPKPEFHAEIGFDEYQSIDRVIISDRPGKQCQYKDEKGASRERQRAPSNRPFPPDEPCEKKWQQKTKRRIHERSESPEQSVPGPVKRGIRFTECESLTGRSARARVRQGSGPRSIRAA